MELVNVKKTSPGHGKFTLAIAGTLKDYEFTYDDPGIVVAHFPDEFTRLLRQLPATVAKSIVNRIITTIESDSVSYPYRIELEKEILASV